ncbi:uncharacterized protein LAJ45_04429 [Morchella importuna]|nr:uncharacterized protein LAJ45_04429 [Morchella importuna]KAH8151807.1 hypothetical protein LAJ45_04429 [Morchella importuna]
MWKNTFRVAIHVNALKPQTHKKKEMLQPLEVLSIPWSSISMDFITKATIEELAQIFLREIWRLHGLPEEIISDQDSRFETYRPQTDGQTERVDQTLEQYLKKLLLLSAGRLGRVTPACQVRLQHGHPRVNQSIAILREL